MNVGPLAARSASFDARLAATSIRCVAGPHFSDHPSRMAAFRCVSIAGPLEAGEIRVAGGRPIDFDGRNESALGQFIRAPTERPPVATHDPEADHWAVVRTMGSFS